MAEKMDDMVTWRGAEVDGALALALLEWQVEMGADEAMLDAPVDRRATPDKAPRPQSPAAQPRGAPVAQQPPQKVAAPTQADAHAAALATARRLAEGAADLAALAQAQQAYDGVELKRGARNFVFADGVAGARVMILDDAPRSDEDAAGHPFAGATGQLLDQMLAAIGMSRTASNTADAAYCASVIPWRPPADRRPTANEIALSLPFLQRHIELAAPEVLVVMGNTAALAALGAEGVLRLRGHWKEAFGRPVMPMTHPSYLLKNPAAKREAWSDLLEIAARLDLPPV